MSKAVFDQIPDNRCGIADRTYVGEVLNDGFGNKDSANMVARFESNFSQYMQFNYAISTNSGTSALIAAMHALGIGPGDEVIVPALTMGATAIAVSLLGATPVFVDVNPHTFTIDPWAVRNAITPLTKAIIPVALFGLEPDIDTIHHLVNTILSSDIAIIGDYAQYPLWPKWRGWFKAVCYSFQGSKHMTTGGSGGMVIANDKDYATRIRQSSILGYAALGAQAGSVQVERDVRQRRDYLRHQTLGFNFRMSPLQAAVGMGQLERLQSLILARQTIANEYLRAIVDSKCDWIIPPFVPPNQEHLFWAYPCEIDKDWDNFRTNFIDNGGDGLYPTWLPVHLEGPYELPYETCPVAEGLNDRLALFKTSMTTWVDAISQATALSHTIEVYNG